MKPINEIDKNLSVKANVDEPDLEWFDIRQNPFSIHGIFFDDTAGAFLRIPQGIAECVSENVKILNSNTSGGRVRFKTDSSYIAIYAVMDCSGIMPHMPRTGQSGFDLYRYDDGKEIYFSTFVPPCTWEHGYSSGTKTFGELAEYTINFPLYDGVKELYIGLKKNSVLDAPLQYQHSVPVVFYGSSITQGGCASRPGNSYQGFLSRKLSMDFVNLGFSGSCKGELEMAKYIADMKMSVLVMDYDSNASTPGDLQATYESFYRTIRAKNPDLPIILISHPSALHGVYYKTKVSAKWGTFEERREIIKRTYDLARKEEHNIYFIDGAEIFKGEDWDAVTVDGVHPNDFGFMKFAQYLEKFLRPLL